MDLAMGRVAVMAAFVAACVISCSHESPNEPVSAISQEERAAAGLPLPDQLTLATKEDIGSVPSVGKEVHAAVRAYLEPREVEWKLTAAREVGDYVLLWIAFPKIADGGVDLIYSIKAKCIVGTFLGGYRG